MYERSLFIDYFVRSYVPQTGFAYLGLIAHFFILRPVSNTSYAPRPPDLDLDFDVDRFDFRFDLDLDRRDLDRDRDFLRLEDLDRFLDDRPKRSVLRDRLPDL